MSWFNFSLGGSEEKVADENNSVPTEETDNNTSVPTGEAASTELNAATWTPLMVSSVPSAPSGMLPEGFDIKTTIPPWEAKGSTTEGNVVVPQYNARKETTTLKKLGFPLWPHKGTRMSEEFKEARELCLKRYHVHLSNNGAPGNFVGSVYYSFDQEAVRAPAKKSSSSRSPPKKSRKQQAAEEQPVLESDGDKYAVFF